ncbi:MAG: hypothetical protein ABEJ28_10855 [Salinigranum sp.]
MTESGNESGRRLLTRETLLLAAILFVGVVGPGLARRALGLAGHSTLGMIVYVVGYGGMVLVVWYGWIRPLEITGPGGK